MNLNEWYQQPLGQAAAKAAAAQLAPWLAKLYGYHIMQCGATGQWDWLTNSAIKHRLYLEPEQLKPLPKNFIQASYSELPFKPGSLDVILFAHVLERVTDPEQVLQDAWHALIPEGHLLILCFNPWSLWRIWKILRLRPKLPHCKRWLSLPKVVNHLSVAGYRIADIKQFMYCSPRRYTKPMPNIALLDKIGRYCWPVFSGLTLIVAKKQVLPLTPIKARWVWPQLNIDKKKTLGVCDRSLLFKYVRRNVYSSVIRWMFSLFFIHFIVVEKQR